MKSNPSPNLCLGEVHLRMHCLELLEGLWMMSAHSWRVELESYLHLLKFVRSGLSHLLYIVSRLSTPLQIRLYPLLVVKLDEC